MYLSIILKPSPACRTWRFMVHNSKKSIYECMSTKGTYTVVMLRCRRDNDLVENPSFGITLSNFNSRPTILQSRGCSQEGSSLLSSLPWFCIAWTHLHANKFLQLIIHTCWAHFWNPSMNWTKTWGPFHSCPYPKRPLYF